MRVVALPVCLLPYLDHATAVTDDLDGVLLQRRPLHDVAGRYVARHIAEQERWRYVGQLISHCLRRRAVAISHNDNGNDNHNDNDEQITKR
jgi:hypothetical protein